MREIYLSKIVADGLMTQERIAELSQSCFERLDAAYQGIESYRPNRIAWKHEPEIAEPAATPLHAAMDDTGVAADRLKEIARALSRQPDWFHRQSQSHTPARRAIAIRRDRREHRLGDRRSAGLRVACGRGSGCPFRRPRSPRGAFSQRHFLLVDQNDGSVFNPFAALVANQGRCDIIGSPLSEYSVLGFEYGYSMDCPRSLVVWEAQFGDFANIAQAVIDQFVVSGEDKWAQKFGGHNHASARP